MSTDDRDESEMAALFDETAGQLRHDTGLDLAKTASQLPGEVQVADAFAQTAAALSDAQRRRLLKLAEDVPKPRWRALSRPVVWAAGLLVAAIWVQRERTSEGPVQARPMVQAIGLSAPAAAKPITVTPIVTDGDSVIAFGPLLDDDWASDPSDTEPPAPTEELELALGLDALHDATAEPPLALP